MTDLEIKAVYRTLADKLKNKKCMQIGPRCIIFKGETIRITPGWVRLRGQICRCNTPAELLKLMAQKGLLRMRNLNLLIEQTNKYLYNK